MEAPVVGFAFPLRMMRSEAREIHMTTLKAGAVLALALTFTGAVPALAHNNLNDWMAMMQRIRLQQKQSAIPHRVVTPRGAFASEQAPAPVVRGPQRSITPGTRP